MAVTWPFPIGRARNIAVDRDDRRCFEKVQPQLVFQQGRDMGWQEKKGKEKKILVDYRETPLLLETESIPNPHDLRYVACMHRSYKQVTPSS